VVLHPTRSNVPLLVTEWAEEGTLSAWMDKHVVKLWAGWTARRAADKAELSKLYLPRVFAVGMQVLRGLVSLHEMKLVHQDLKPGNVLVFAGEKGMPRGVPLTKLGDFGLCGAGAEDGMEVDGESESKEEVDEEKKEFGARLGGTRKWMSPEQGQQFLLARQGKLETVELDASFDMWAFGLVLACIVSEPTNRAVEEYQKWLQGHVGGLAGAVGEMPARVQSVVEAAAEEAKAVGGADKQVGAAWEAIVGVLRLCLGEEGRASVTARQCEERLQGAYRSLSATRARFGAVVPSSLQAEMARDLDAAFRPKEREVCKHFPHSMCGPFFTLPFCRRTFQ
jgi:hypothetical protein